MAETSQQNQSAEPEVETRTENIKFFNIHDGLRGRDGTAGLYLDQAERVGAERIRAQAEEREPDYDNAGAVAGTPLVTIDKVPDNTNANPSMAALNTDLQDAVAKTLEENATAVNPQSLEVTYAVTDTPANEADDSPVASTTAKKTTESSESTKASSSSSSSSDKDK